MDRGGKQPVIMYGRCQCSLMSNVDVQIASALVPYCRARRQQSVRHPVAATAGRRRPFKKKKKIQHRCYVSHSHTRARPRRVPCSAWTQAQYGWWWTRAGKCRQRNEKRKLKREKARCTARFIYAWRWHCEMRSTAALASRRSKCAGQVTDRTAGCGKEAAGDRDARTQVCSKGSCKDHPRTALASPRREASTRWGDAVHPGRGIADRRP
jgi:hypothetical protein